MNVWKLFQELEYLREGLSKPNRDGTFASIPKESYVSEGSHRRFPLLNISDDKDHVYLEALAPGVLPESLNVTMTRNTLTITGEKPALKIEADHYHRNERGAGKFTRTIELPGEVDSEKVGANYKNGILQVTISKTEVSKPKQINVNLK